MKPNIEKVLQARFAEYLATGTFLLEDKATSLLRCVATRLGLYSDAVGVLSDRLQQLTTSATGSLTDAKLQLARQCEANVWDSHVDVCHVASHSIETCYGRRAFVELWKSVAEEFGHPKSADADTGRYEIYHANEYESQVQGTSEVAVVYCYPARKGVISRWYSWIRSNRGCT
uniref:Uncharacterized protein n=1 Tax=Anopheles atroparvus TaxID=41427 RepID=A0A182J0V9_ANOAO